MLINNEIKIKADAATVWKALKSPDFNKQWQKGLKSYRQIEGSRMEPGSKGAWTFTSQGHEEEVLEEVQSVKEGREWTGIFRYDCFDGHLTTEIKSLETGTLLRCSLKIVFRSDSPSLTTPFLKNIFKSRQEEDLMRLKQLLEGGS